MSENNEELKKLAYLAIISFGLISLFGDIIYEGARGIVPTYLMFLGATALIVGLVGGLGEFLGYSLRLVSGYLADTTRSYWLFVFLGYGLLISIPLLAFTGYWQIAIILVLIERIAKALRAPARDTIFSVVTKGVGTGKAFGLHEFMDQLGAISGPLIVATVLYFTGNKYFYAFLILLVPYLFLIIILSSVYVKMKLYTKTMLSTLQKNVGSGETRLPSGFKFYTFAVILNTAGLIHVSLILYIASNIMFPWMVAILYLMLQGIDAIIAPFSGYVYDKTGRSILLIPFVLSVIPTIFALMGTFSSVIIAALFFGIILGMQESIYRAAVSDLTPIEKRGTAYGIFNAAYGFGFLISGFLFGYFIDYGLFLQAIVFSVLMQVVALVFLFRSVRS